MSYCFDKLIGSKEDPGLDPAYTTYLNQELASQDILLSWVAWREDTSVALDSQLDIFGDRYGW